LSINNKKELKVHYENDKLQKLYQAKALFEKDAQYSVEMDDFIDILVEAFLSYRNIRGATESQLLQKIANKNPNSTPNSEP
jgi:hypothetical protein